MSLITASNISKSYGASDIFRDVSLTIARGARLALVGPNGCGKTTLLRILVGEEQSSSGTITRAKNLRIGYLPQEAKFDIEETVWEACLSVFADLLGVQEELHRLEALMLSSETRHQALIKYGPLQQEFEQRGGYTFQTQIKRVLTGLGFSTKEYKAPISRLSGGQRTRAFLARLLLLDPDLLLLDEPTNHLDIAAVEWLEYYLNQWQGAVVFVSHDRYFIDKVSNGLLEMAFEVTEFYPGNYSAYLRTREERWDYRRETFEAEKEHLLKDITYIKKNIAGQNTLQAKGKLKRLSRIVQAIEQAGMDAVLNKKWAEIAEDITINTSPFGVEEAEKRVRALRPPSRTIPSLHLNLYPAKRSGELVIQTKNVRIGYTGRLLFSAPDIILRRKECAALIGPNGAGKTTFLKTILGQIEPLEGEVNLGASLIIGYFAQAHEGLNPKNTLIQEIEQAAPHWLPSNVRDYLGKYLFSGDDVFKKVEVLSGGEHGRLALATLALQENNLLLLDEPTNHLDIPSQEVLQSVLQDYEGTILLVTHDRYLIDALGTQIWEIETDESKLTVYNGTYSQRNEERERKASLLETNEKLQKPGSSQSKDPYIRASTIKKKEKRRRNANLQRIENKINCLDAELANIESELENPPDDLEKVAQLGRDYNRVQREIDGLIKEWETLQV